MPYLKIPCNLKLNAEVHEKWVKIIKQVQGLVAQDIQLQGGIRLKERSLPPEILGRLYAQYCALINKIYDTYLNNVQIQRTAYIVEIIHIIIKRLYELRNELVHVIVNDYIYVDSALQQSLMEPLDIQIVVPYHFAIESRPDTIEELLQKMWADAVKRKNAPPKTPSEMMVDDENREVNRFDDDDDDDVSKVVEESVVPEEYIHSNIIQKQERYRLYFIADYKAKCIKRKMYLGHKPVEAAEELKILAATLIQKTYREYMKLKRKRLQDTKRDILLGITSDPFRQRLVYEEENIKMYERRRKERERIHDIYTREIERERVRLYLFKREDQISDITDHIYEWFNEWYKGYGFFPEYPYPIEGGTIMVIRGDFTTVEEKILLDEKLAAATKGKTADMLKAEKEQAKFDAKMKVEAEKERLKKEADNLFKARCNPQSDPGYEIQTSENTHRIAEILQEYRATWSTYDQCQAEVDPEIVYGYMMNMLTEDLMTEMHKEARMFVDEIMRLELKLLIKAHQTMYKRLGWKYPKIKPRKKPKPLPVPKPLNIDDDLLKNLESVFDLGIVSKPKCKIRDIFGDNSYAAYEYNIRDPDATFPLPCYGDLKNRLKLSCVFGSGIEPSATRNKTVMLLGPHRNGKSFLVDCIAGELNATKIDITPEVFSAVVDKPAKKLPLVFQAARVFQPSVIFMKNVERVYCKKIPPEDKYLNAKIVKKPLEKLLKAISAEDKVIFIATCSNPFVAQAYPMVSIFNEMIVVPRTDYASLQQFFHQKLQTVRSMPRDYCVQSIAQALQGYGFGVINEAYNAVINSERICKLNVIPLSPREFLEYLLENNHEALSKEEYQEYINFYLNNCHLGTERQQYNVINEHRDVIYKKLAKKRQEAAN